MKKITLIFVGFFCIVAFLNAQNADVNTYFNDHFVGGLADDGENIWVGVDSLLVKMDKTSGETIVSYTIPISSEYQDQDRYASSISLDSKGMAWIVCTGPIRYLETFNGEKSWVEIPIPTPWFSGLVIDKNDKIWASTIAGLHEYDGNGWIDYNSSNTELPYSSFTALAVDNQNNKWLGLTFGLGEAPVFLVKFDEIQFTMFASSYLNLIGGVIWSIDISPSGIVWLGTYGNGLISFDGGNWNGYNSTNSEIPPDAVSIVTVEGANIVWLSTSSGLTRFDGETWKTFTAGNSMLPSNAINSILVDENGTKWVGTDKGLISFRGNALGTSDEQNPEVEFKLFPNPANDFITLKIPSDHMGSTVEIYNIMGKVMKSFRMDKNNHSIDVSNWAKGFYLIRLQTMDGVAVKKFVKK